MAKLWQKDYELNKLVEEFTVGKDHLLDLDLVPFDCISSIAHAQMLTKINILTAAEFTKLKTGLTDIINLHKKGLFKIDRTEEDCHTAIENHLTKNIGEAGKKIHTGRSRNDQVLTALRMYTKSAVIKLLEEGANLADTILHFADTNKDVPMPGRTHMQIAMPSSVGLWADAWAEEIVDSIKNLYSVYELLDQCPLGAAASYGTPLPLDREMTAKLLGFSKIQNNVLYVNNSRGRLDSLVLNALEHAVLILSSTAQDLIFFSLPEFGYFSLPAELCSGSSIMPQKKNPDILELIRAKSSTISSYCLNVKQIVRSMTSGYNRDFQETKEPLLRTLELTMQCFSIMKLTFSKLVVNRENLLKSFTPDIFATDAAFELVMNGKTFREAYKNVGLNIEKLGKLDPVEINKSRTSTGTAGALNLDAVAAEINLIKKNVAHKKETFNTVIKNLSNSTFSIL